MPARSYLYVPGHRPDRVPKAAASAADAVIIDLEDAVPVAAKATARAAAAAALRAGSGGTPLWVRVNPGADDLAADLAAVVGPGLAGVWLPKAEPAALARLDDLLTGLERERGLPGGAVPVVALVETAAGVLHAEEVCRAPRVVRLGIGEADLAGELRVRPDPDRTELHGVRLQVVLACAATGLPAPVGPVETNVTDTDRLAHTTATLLRQGFRARTALHPRQVPVINAGFTATAEEVAAAEALLARVPADESTAVDPDGHFLDPAVLRTARETLDRG
ncbi:Citrate lyase beta chain [Actinokineospora spheciospongiae]|uniref:Citrate lyase beta chain n=1 Tax=Actinokineospora spheciospongiae TaxID=909613 RepID=W7ISC5_9PSEU|nr:aldolase/citrate lyase family protein [Actinokineospora spheciospongiae]EWC59617.1 Citrate lyase beta chain [Actinokineospora spheciospongiae]PWW67175.1 citrate lyase subunit beta/citryl-CoA lyase [Actinokineospora spheciospongiae]